MKSENMNTKEEIKRHYHGASIGSYTSEEFPINEEEYGTCIVELLIHGSQQDGYVLSTHDQADGPDDAPDTIYPTLRAAMTAAELFVGDKPDGVIRCIGDYAEAGSLPASVLARWAAEDWDDRSMTASHYTYETEDGPIDLTEAEADLYVWGQTEDNAVGGSQRGDLRLSGVKVSYYAKGE